MEKIKVLVLADSPLAPSGVAGQTRYMIEGLLQTGRYQFVNMGGAIRHPDYTPIKVEEYGDDWVIYPVDGYGTQEMIRSVLRTEKPDILWFMTDPRFWGWLWDMENEIRPLCPMVYYHVWDNFPAPMFNRNYYLSNDYVATISKVTDEIVKKVAPEVTSVYLPHAVNSDIFKPMPLEQIRELRKNSLDKRDVEKTIFFWNNRNARRKQFGTLIWWFKEWLDKENLHDKASLIMHTDPKDPHGQDLEHILHRLNLTDRQIMLSTAKVSQEQLSMMYNISDCTINISDAEGFGLSTLESLSCGTPIIANMTGGLQEQVTDGQKEFGIPLFPSSKAIIGSQQVPYIYEDRIDKKQFHSALSKIYKMGAENRRKIGLEGRQHVLDNYSFEVFKKRWINFMDKVYDEHGSWSTRKNYQGITFKEVA